MMQIHKDAKPLIVTNEGKDVHVGWRMTTHDFTFDAVDEKSDDSVNVYIEWGDDQPGDMMSFGTWFEVRSYLDSLMQASQR